MPDHQLQDSRQPFFWCDQRILEMGLTTAQIAVYCVLARYADATRRCYPGVRRIAKHVRCGHATVIRAVGVLAAKGLVRVTPRTSDSGDRTSNLYELVDLDGRGGAPQKRGVSPVDHGGPLQKHGWSATETEQEPIEQEPMKEGGRRSTDPLLELFAAEFNQRHGHRPSFNEKHLGRWSDLRRAHPERVLRAKIDAWWDHPLPRSFSGNRTFGAFLQWFDDIVVDQVDARGPPILTVGQLRIEMLNGTSLGKGRYRELIGDIADPDARVRSLMQWEGIENVEQAKAIIAACDAAGT